MWRRTPFARLRCCDVELAYTLAIGFALNGIIGVVGAAAADYAGVVQQTVQTPFVSGAAGGLVAAIVHAAALTEVDDLDEAERRQRASRALRYGVYSVIVGAISAHFVGQAALSFTTRIDEGDLAWLGFLIGAVAFETAGPTLRTAARIPPLIVRGVGRALRDMAIRQLGGTPPPDAPSGSGEDR